MNLRLILFYHPYVVGCLFVRVALLLKRATVEVEAFSRRLVRHWLSRILTLAQGFSSVLDLTGHLSNLAISPEHLWVLRRLLLP